MVGHAVVAVTPVTLATGSVQGSGRLICLRANMGLSSGREGGGTVSFSLSGFLLFRRLLISMMLPMISTGLAVDFLR